MIHQNEHKPGYKKTQLGWIPENWKVTKFSDVFFYLSTNSYSREQLTLEQTNSSIYNIHYGDIHSKFESEILDFEIETKIPKLIDSITLNGNASYLKDGDFVIADASEDYEGVGESIELKNIGNKKVIGGLHTIVARDSNGSTSQGFRTYILNNPIISKALKTIATGISVYSISKSELSKLSILLPSINEQYKIATIFSTWDEAISKTKHLIAKLQQRNKGLMKQLLAGEKRLKGFKGEWKRLHIFDFAKEVSLKNRSDKQLTVLSCTKYDGLVPSLEYFGRRVFGSDTSMYKIVPLNHFAYATNHIEEGSIGYQCIFEEALTSPMYTVFKTSDQVHNDYLLKRLKSHSYIHEYCKRMEGSIDRRGGLRWNEFSKIVIYLPELDEQIAIATFINKAVEEVTLNAQKLALLQQQKKGLMQKLLTGEVRVKIDKNHK